MPQITVTLDLNDDDHAAMLSTLGERTPEDWLTENCLSLVKQIADAHETRKLAAVGLTSLASLTSEEKVAIVAPRATKIATEKAALAEAKLALEPGTETEIGA